MALCNKCVYYNKEFDEMRQTYDDVIVLGEKHLNHYCPMYDDAIPNGIFYENNDCPYYNERGSTNGVQS